MAIDIECPHCETDDHLFGTPQPDGTIQLTCHGCGHVMTRDPRPACPTCGGVDLLAAPRLLVERSRGTQMSIQGVQREFLCRDCDQETIAQRRDGYLPDRLPGSQ